MKISIPGFRLRRRASGAALALALISLAGCTTYRSPELPDRDTAIVQGARDGYLIGVVILRVDGVRTGYVANPTSVRVTAGRHTLALRYIENTAYADGALEFDCEAGQAYLIRCTGMPRRLGEFAAFTVEPAP